MLNVTPDSFSDGGKFPTPQAAVDFANQLYEQGADWIDVGGESTRPGSLPVSPDEQIRRVVPVIQLLRRRSPILISIDTTHSAVAQAALDAGADVINDISSGRADPRMFPLAAQRQSPIILLHMQGVPADMQARPTYQDVTREVAQFLTQRRDIAVSAGIDPRRILLDPGIGFGKSVSHNLQLLRDTPILVRLGHPLVVGPSRKWFIGQIIDAPQPRDRLFGTAAAVALAIANGAGAVRVHDVGPMAQVVRMARAISAGKTPEFLKE
ncbi:MAG: dihydropteroate synthase [Tepidisphaeraceae bacterium]